MSRSIDFGSEITGKIKESIKTKLADLGSYIDEELPDYIMIMIANRKSKAQMVDDLQLFLNNNTDSFVTWLQELLQQIETESAAKAPPSVQPVPSNSSSGHHQKKLETKPSNDHKRKSSENLASKPISRSESDEGTKDSSFRQDLDLKGGEDDNLGVEDSGTSSHHHSNKSKRDSVFDDDKQETRSSRRRNIEQLPVARKNSRRSRSRSPIQSRRRDSRSRSRSPRGSGGFGRRNSGRESNRRSAHDRRGRDSPGSDRDGSDNDIRNPSVSSTARPPPRRAPGAQPTTSLLMRAIAEAKSSIEGVPQSEIKVPPNSSLASSKNDERDRDRSEDEVDIRDSLRRDRRRGGVRPEKERPGDRQIRSLHVVKTDDGGFLSRSKQSQMKKQKEIMSELLLRQIEQEEREREKEGRKSSASDNHSGDEGTKRKEDDEAVRAFNKTAVMDKSTKIIENTTGNGSLVENAANSTDVLMKALFHSSSDDASSNAIPMVPNKNNPQFIVTLEGVDEQIMMGKIMSSGQISMAAMAPAMPIKTLVPPSVGPARLPLSQRLEPRAHQPITSRLGPPVENRAPPLAEFVSSAGEENNEDNQGMQVEEGSQQVNTDVEMKERPPERCRFWPKCKAGDACVFAHPSQPCKTFPACRFGARCLYIHPDCKFDTACLNPDCPFTHRGNPPQTTSVPPATTAAVVSTAPVDATTVTTAPSIAPVASSVAAKPIPGAPPVCRYYPNCANLFCLFTHPKPCRFGASCYHKATCTFWHPPSTIAGASVSVAASKLRWTAPSLTNSSTTAASTVPQAAPAAQPPPANPEPTAV